MLIYYRGAGINADLALVLNLVILLGFMGFVGGTLTLPGIAGVILTIGMGVDSNVLIFERIREEMRGGQDGGGGGAEGLWHDRRAGHDCGYARDDDCFCGDFVYLRHRAGARVCADADVRSAGELCLLRCLCRGRSSTRCWSGTSAARSCRSSGRDVGTGRTWGVELPGWKLRG